MELNPFGTAPIRNGTVIPAEKFEEIAVPKFSTATRLRVAQLVLDSEMTRLDL